MWHRVNKRQPCAICEHDSWCSRSDDGAVAWCCRVKSDKPVRTRTGVGDGWLHFLAERPKQAQLIRRRVCFKSLETNPPNLGHLSREMFTNGRKYLKHLAGPLGVTVTSLAAIGAGLSKDGFWAFPERNGKDEICGIQYRDENGRKWQHTGGHRGLTIPANFASTAGHIYIPEGASDTAALLSCGLRALGRPNNSGGAEQITEYVRHIWPWGEEQIIVLGERDQRDSPLCKNCGNCNLCFPGVFGARTVSRALATWGLRVSIHLPPQGYKDVRTWVQRHGYDGKKLEKELEEVGEGSL